MIPLIGLLSVAGIIVGIYALIKGSAPRLGIKGRKVATIILCVSFLLFIIAIASDTPSETAAVDEEPATEEVAAPPEEPAEEEPAVYSEAAKNAFIAWESDIMIIHARADNATEAFSLILTDFGEGKTDIYSTYNEAKRTRDIVNSARRDINRVDLGDDLSDDHKSILKDAASTLSTGLFVKTEALDLILKFLDDPKPSYINEATENFNRGYIYMIEGLGAIIVVKAELGLLDDEDSE